MQRRSETGDHALRAAEKQVLEMIADGSELSTVVSLYAFHVYPAHLSWTPDGVRCKHSDRLILEEA
jgi:hypothetical protein